MFAAWAVTKRFLISFMLNYHGQAVTVGQESDFNRSVYLHADDHQAFAQANSTTTWTKLSDVFRPEYVAWALTNTVAGNTPTYSIDNMKLHFHPCTGGNNCADNIPVITADITLPFGFLGVRGSFVQKSTGVNKADDCNGASGHASWEPAITYHDGYVMFGTPSTVIYGGCAYGANFDEETTAVPETLFSQPETTVRFAGAQSVDDEYFSVDLSNIEVLEAPTPTQAPTDAPAAGSSASPVTSAKGDPHLQNINGQRFDLMRPGKHVLLHIPRGADAPHVLLRVEAEVQRMGPQCGDMYFQHVNITGAWVEAKHNGILQFHAGEAGGAEGPTWMAFGAVQLKVVRVHWQGIHYLNLFAKHLGRTGFTVGGLLGEDDHTYEATPDHDCVPTLNLNLHGTMMGLHSASPSTPSASSAEASLA